MNEFIEKLIKRLEEKKDIFLHDDSDYGEGKYNAYGEAIEIVNQLAEEYNNESVKGDLISRSALIKTLNEYVTKAYDCGGIDGENVIEYQQTHDDKSAYIIQGFNEVYELLEDVPTAYNDDWIPCITALPEEKKVYFEILDIWSDVSDCVWVTLKNSEVAHAYMENGKWYYSTGIIIETDVIAWKPLDKPAPYQPKGE